MTELKLVGLLVTELTHQAIPIKGLLTLDYDDCPRPRVHHSSRHKGGPASWWGGESMRPGTDEAGIPVLPE